MKFVMNSCNRILVLNFGQKICEGTPDEVKANHQVQEAYFGKGIIAGEAVKFMLKVENLSVNYGYITALTNISFHVEKGRSLP